MKVKTGILVSEEVRVKDDVICFFNEEGDREFFSIKINEDKKSIRIYGGNYVKEDGIIYSDTLIIAPIAANCIEITKPIYTKADEERR